MQVNPGDLNKSIKIIKHIAGGQDDEGFVVEPSDVVIRNCKAKFSQISGTEMIKSGAEFATGSYRFLIRTNKTVIDTDMCVLYKGIEYDIKYINTYGDGGQYTELWANKRELV